jgi:TPR repeat protein
MVDLAAVAGTDAPELARYWYERAAILGNVQEMGEIPRFSD